MMQLLYSAARAGPELTRPSGRTSLARPRRTFLTGSVSVPGRDILSGAHRPIRPAHYDKVNPWSCGELCRTNLCTIVFGVIY